MRQLREKTMEELKSLLLIINMADRLDNYEREEKRLIIKRINELREEQKHESI